MDAMLALEKPAPGSAVVVTALREFDAFLLAHAARLNVSFAANAMLSTPETAMHASQHLRAGDAKSPYFQRWSGPVAGTLENLANGAARKSLNSLATGLFLHSWLLSHPDANNLPQARLTDLEHAEKVDVLRALRANAVLSAAWDFWPPLDPAATETAVLVDLLNRDPILARSHLTSLLGLTPGDPASFGTRLRDWSGGAPSDLLVVAGNPPRFYRVSDAGAKQQVVWPWSPPAGFQEAQKQLDTARDALRTRVSLYENMRRFWGLDNARRRVAEYQGGPISASPDGSARRAYDEAQAKYDKEPREGIYVSPTAPPPGTEFTRSRVTGEYTRSLTQSERMQRDLQMERLKRNLDDEVREIQRRESVIAAQAEARNELSRELAEIERKVDTRGYLADIERLKRDVEFAEQRVNSLLTEQIAASHSSGLSLDSLPRAEAFRWLLRNMSYEGMVVRATRAKKSGTPEDDMELRWCIWLFALTITDDGRKSFFGTEEAQRNHEDEKRRGKPLADFAGPLLAPLSKNPLPVIDGLDPVFVPRLFPSADWRLNQVTGLLDDCWVRFQYDPVLMREKVFAVVKAVRAAVGTDAISVESLRPWVKRFRDRASADLQAKTLRWDKEPHLTGLLELAAK